MADVPSPSERVAADPDLRRVLATARAWGVSPSVFLGRVLATRHEYDMAGRLVRSVADLAWLGEDRDLALAFADYERDVCSGCGQPLATSTAAVNEERYVASVQALCHGCAALDAGRVRAEKHPHPGALLLGLELRAPVGDGVEVTGEPGE